MRAQGRNEEREVVLLGLLDGLRSLLGRAAVQVAQVVQPVDEFRDSGPRTLSDYAAQVPPGRLLALRELGERSHIERDVSAEVEGEAIWREEVGILRHIVQKQSDDDAGIATTELVDVDPGGALGVIEIPSAIIARLFRVAVLRREVGEPHALVLLRVEYNFERSEEKFIWGRALHASSFLSNVRRVSAAGLNA